MEQKCETGGEILRYQHVLNEDRISELPEALLLKILSSLPTKQVKATSVFSKQWRSLWKMVPHLMFDSEHDKSKNNSFSDIVFRSLLSHKAPVLESLHLRVRHESEALDVGIWIGIAFARNVRKLVLNLNNEYDDSATFPNVLWSCDNTTLETLEFITFVRLEFPAPVCFKSLRKLHLEDVMFDNEESVCNFFSGCPRLEDLFVGRKSTIDVGTFTVDVPSLQRLTIVDYFLGEDGRYVINAPCLKYLSIKGFRWIESCLINAPEVVEAKVIGVSSIENENILESLASVKRLSLDLTPLEQIKFPVGIIYHHLVSLELFTGKGWNLLSLMLESCPKLQILKLTDRRYSDKEDCPVGWGWSQPTCVPECLLFQLETFVWTRYEWQREEEKEVAIYILKNARRLKTASITTKAIKPPEREKLEKRREVLEKKLEKRREVLNQLASEVKVFNTSCHLMLECEPY